MTLVLWCVALTVLEIGTAILLGRGQVLAAALPWGGLFYVYGRSLENSTLTAVTVGWIVTSQIAAVLVDRYLNQVHISTQTLIGIAIMLFGVVVMTVPIEEVKSWI